MKIAYKLLPRLLNQTLARPLLHFYRIHNLFRTEISEIAKKKENEELEREMKNGLLSLIRNVSEIVVKITNRVITIQEGNRFHNTSEKNETIIIGNKMSRV